MAVLVMQMMGNTYDKVWEDRLLFFELERVRNGEEKHGFVVYALLFSYAVIFLMLNSCRLKQLYLSKRLSTMTCMTRSTGAHGSTCLKGIPLSKAFNFTACEGTRDHSVYTVSDIEESHKDLANACQHRSTTVEHFSAVYCSIALGNVHCVLCSIEIRSASGEFIRRV
ncbi:hypothetical protein GQ600_22472 [Phytophthora cactorum]|nr:hypothetical protein GQ600_22472 [Phytophthora cactorum]